jgi:hypothetical protein
MKITEMVRFRLRYCAFSPLKIGTIFVFVAHSKSSRELLNRRFEIHEPSDTIVGIAPLLQMPFFINISRLVDPLLSFVLDILEG